MSEPGAARWWVLALIAAISALATGAAWNYPVVIVGDLLRDLHLEDSDWGTLWAGISLGLLLVSLPAGALGDRIGARSALALGLLGIALALACRALAGSFAVFLATMIGTGAGLALVLSNVPKALAQWFPPAQLGLANGVSQAGVGLGIGCTFWVVPRLVASGTGWRQLSGALAAVLAGLALLWWTTVRDLRPPRAEAPPLLAALLDVARVPDVRWIALCYALYLGGYLGAIGYLPLHLVASQGMEATAAGSALALGPWSFLLGSLLLPALSDRVGRRRPIYAVGMALGGLALFSAARSVDLALAASMFALGFSTAAVALLFVIPVELPEVGPARAASAAGLATTVGFLGGIVSTWLGVQLAQRGAGLGFGFWAASLIASALLILRVRETGRAS